MIKSTFSQEYLVFLECLRTTRKEAGLTQEQLAEHLYQTQSFISKCERGERRIDIVELRAFCLAFKMPLADFIQKLEIAIQQNQ
ncbi:MAG: helix-turn-helix transcriptional regulator [Cyanobacteria bacterium P01_E01_bin.42]